MEQLINNMLTMQVPQAAPAAKKTATADKDGFQKLLEQKQSAGTASAPQKQERTDAAQEPQDAQKTQEAQKTQDAQGETQEPQQVQAAPKSAKVLEDQMSLAAMALLRNPLVADIAEETPQILTDPNWQDGLVPVGYDDYEEQGIRIVHWMQPEAAGAENLDAKNNVAADWMQEMDETQAAPEAPVDVPEIVEETKTTEVKVKVETGDVSQEGENEEGPELPQEAEVEAPVFEDVKAVPVKVGEAPKAETAKPVEEQIAPKLTEALQNGETRVELQLTPENLGKVTIEVTLKQDGGLVVQLHAENRDTQNLLSKNLSGLEALLGRQTQQEVRVEVPRQEESQRQDLYEQQQEHHRQQQQERRSRQESDSEAFLQQLRLGLIPMDEE